VPVVNVEHYVLSLCSEIDLQRERVRSLLLHRLNVLICSLFGSRRLQVVGYDVLEDSFFMVDTFFSSESMTSVFGEQDILISCLSLAAVVDVLIAIAMTYLLVRKRAAATGFAGQAHSTYRRENTTECRSISSAHILHRLTIFAVNTGIWTAMFAVLSAILVRVVHHWQGFRLIHCRCISFRRVFSIWCLLFHLARSTATRSSPT
jgi:hypothetical protein